MSDLEFRSAQLTSLTLSFLALTRADLFFFLYIAVCTFLTTGSPLQVFTPFFYNY
jgi:hypothetical protein